MIDIELSKDYARVFCEEIEGETEKIEFVGAIRRRVHKIETISMIIIPRNVSSLGEVIIRIASEFPPKLGPKLISFSYVHFRINLFIANRSNYELLKFIRTGPDTFCKKACQKARELGLKLHADGSGIEKLSNGTWLYPRSEEDIFLCLGWPYIEPQNRI